MGGTHQPADYLSSLEDTWADAPKKTYGYRARDEAKRQAFLAELATKLPESLVYLDESGSDKAGDDADGGSECGQRFHACKLGHHTQGVSLIAALHQQEWFAPFTLEGDCNRHVFETWLEQCFIPLLQPGQTGILDNAPFHKSQRTQTLVESAGGQLLYLPPDSPDLNQIEPYWFPLKPRIRKTVSRYPSFREAVDAAFC